MGNIALTPAEIESGLDRVKWAESLIKQLPEDHEGRNSWLLNYGAKPMPDFVRYCLMDISHGYSEDEYLEIAGDPNYGYKDKYIKVIFDGETGKPKHTELVEKKHEARTI